MTQKDYKMIAEQFAAMEKLCGFNDFALASLRLTAEKIADGCQEQNPRFKRDLFIAACFPFATAGKAGA